MTIVAILVTARVSNKRTFAHNFVQPESYTPTQWTLCAPTLNQEPGSIGPLGAEYGTGISGDARRLDRSRRVHWTQHPNVRRLAKPAFTCGKELR
jgi:hypothetical protein